MLPLLEQLKVLDKALGCPETPLLRSYALTFMRVFCQYFRNAEPLFKAGAYWQIRLVRTPFQLIQALENLDSDPMVACRLLETVEDCVAHCLGALPFTDALQKEAGEMKLRFRESAKREAEMRYVQETLRAGRRLGVEELQQISTRVFGLLERILSK